MVVNLLRASSRRVAVLDTTTYRAIAARVRSTNDPAFGATAGRLTEAIDSLERATAWMSARLKSETKSVLAGATPYLRLFAIAAGGSLLAYEANKTADEAADEAARVAQLPPEAVAEVYKLDQEALDTQPIS